MSGFSEHIPDHTGQPGQGCQGGHTSRGPSCRHLPPSGQVSRQEHLVPPPPAPPAAHRHQQGRVQHLRPPIKSWKRRSSCPCHLSAGCHKVWNLSNRSSYIQHFNPRSLSSCQFSPSGAQVVTMASDDKLRLYNTQNAAPSLQPVAQGICP